MQNMPRRPGAPLQIPSAEWSWRADLGRQGGYCASIILLHALTISSIIEKETLKE